MRQLPIFRGYTVDVRLKQFRKVYWSKDGNPQGVSFICFDSPKGSRLYRAWIKTPEAQEELKTTSWI